MKRLSKGCAGFVVVLSFLNSLVAEEAAADKTSSIKLGYENRVLTFMKGLSITCI